LPGPHFKTDVLKSLLPYP